jgi:glycosyltransferase involved in cell wall biosynthesis
LVKDKWNGRLVKVEDADDYASAIIEALNNDELRKTMECRCKEIAEGYSDLQVKRELGLIYGNAPLSS